MGGEGKGDSPKTNPDIDKKLGIDQIADPNNREIVRNYFEQTLTPEQRSSLIHEKTKSDISKLRQKIQSLNERKASAEEFVQEIIKTMQADVLERDLNDGYIENGVEQKSYIEYYLSLVGSRSVGQSDVEKKYDPKFDGKSTLNIWWYTREPFDYCMNKVKGVARSVPLDVKREIRHQYVQEYIRALGETLDDFEAGWFDEFDQAEIPAMEKQFATNYPQLVNFNAWLTQRGLKIDDVTVQYNKLDTKSIVETKTRLESMKKNLDGYTKAQQDYYTQQIQNIEALALTSPGQAGDQIATLEKDMGALSAFTAFGNESLGTLDVTSNVRAKDQGLRKKFDDFKGKYDDFDPKFSAQIDDFEKKYNERSAQLDSEKDAQKRLLLLDFSDLKKARDQIDFDMVKASEDLAKKAEANKPQTPENQPAAPDAAAAAPEEEQGFLDQAVTAAISDPKSETGKMVKGIIDNLAKIPLIGGFILSAFFTKSTLSKLGVTAPSDLDSFFKSNNAPKNPEQLKEIEAKAKKVLQDLLKIDSTSDLEAVCKTLNETKVKDFMKKKPDKFDQKKYDNLIAALKKNGGADDTSDKTVFQFVLLKIGQNEWKSES